MKEEKIVTLLVEDDEAHAVLTMRTLEEEGVSNEIHWVTDGEEALEYLFQTGSYADETKSPRPDLIILDLRLPKRDGHEVLSAIKQSADLKVIPVVVLTTSENDEDMTRAYNNYANSYLVKPLGFGEFSEMIRELRSYWLARNIPPFKHRQA